MGWGTLWSDRGNYERALRLYQKAAWCAQRFGIKWLAAEVHHDMLVLASETGDYKSAVLYASRALSIYPVHNARVPALAYDFALLLVRQQIYGAALRIVEPAVRYISSPQERVIVEALVARAAAGSGAAPTFERSASRVLAAIGSGIDARAAGSFIHLTAAAQSRQDWTCAEEWSAEAVRIVEERGLGGEERVLAHQLRRDVLARKIPPPPRDLLSAESDMGLITEVYSRTEHIVAGWRGATWRRKRQAGPDERGKT
jgi:tetratricopeptide (TPR) repeat protein